MFENKTAKEPIRLEKIDHFAAQDNEPYPWHRSLYVCNKEMALKRDHFCCQLRCDKCIAHGFMYM